MTTLRMKGELNHRLREISNRLHDKYRAQQIYLFGSHATGTATEHSDVDILVVAPARERFFDRMATVLGLVRDLYGGLALSPIVLRPEELRRRLKRGDDFLKDIVENGVKI